MIKLEKGMVPFWSDELIDKERTTATLSVNRAQREEVVLTFDEEWEGDAVNFCTVIKDEDIYRLYYESWSWSFIDPGDTDGINVCYAESRDLKNWTKPNLGLYEFRGSKNNNIMMPKIEDNMTVMLDENPDCPPERRYKALMSVHDTRGYIGGDDDTSKAVLVCLVSADGIHFEKYSVVSRGYGYDSMNSLIWNAEKGRYYCFFREVRRFKEDTHPTENRSLIRGIRLMESEDLISWTEPVALDYKNADDCQLYTNCVSQYIYDKRYFVGFPTRYAERKTWTGNHDRLCGVEKRKIRSKKELRLGTAVTDCLFMSSRDGYRWHRYDEACITPGAETEFNWVYGDCYPALGGLIETPSEFEGEPPRLSLFLPNRHWNGAPVQLTRYSYRRDGFASVKGDFAGKVLTTLPFTFDGDEMTVNFASSAAGSIYIRVLDREGNAIPGYRTYEMFGDSLCRQVDFEKDPGALAGREIRLEITLKDAEIFSFTLK